MSHAMGSYSFLPWLRHGVASSIGAVDGDEDVALRAAIRVELELSGAAIAGGTLRQTIARDVQLYGPGDIVGIDPRAIIRTEPRDWITNFEPNYLAAVEFYDEDFPWRYTPAAPDAARLRLRPWIALVVLAESEFKDGKDKTGRPLPYIEVEDAGLFPPAQDLWAWAHVHVNRSLAANEQEFVSSDMAAVLPRLQAVLGENPDLAYSRIVCPRRLAEKTLYHAFVVPVFESGRLAGLGKDPTKAPFATESAWAPYQGREEPKLHPVYFRWAFHTGAQGDFESLVRLLEPRPVDARVGNRDVDVVHPGSNLPPIANADLAGVLKLGGALRVPRKSLDADQLAEVDRYENWAKPPTHAFVSAMAKFVNLADDYAGKAAKQVNDASGLSPFEDNRDPLLTAPLYGRWHALTERLLVDRDGNPVPLDANWVHELNLDPRFRVAAAFGTRVVQQYQDEYMIAAWKQIGDVIEANRRIRQAQLAREVAWTWHARHLLPLLRARPERALAWTAPAQRHARIGGATVQHLRAQAHVAPALTSVVARRVTRPAGRVMRSLTFDATRSAGNLLARVNAGAVSAAPPRLTPPALPTVDQVADRLAGDAVPAAARDALQRMSWLQDGLIVAALLLALFVLVVVSGVALVVGLVAAAALGVLWWQAGRWQRALARSDGVRDRAHDPAAIDGLPKNPGFSITVPGSGSGSSPGSTDSPESVRFKSALRDWFTLRSAGLKAAERPPLAALALADVTRGSVEAVDPVVTIPRRVAAGIKLPPRIVAGLGDLTLAESFDEIMAYPEIDVPMYKPLTDIDGELFLPNLNLIPPNSITLLETNQRFIEAYMVGLNHEFARELLWREYPTDQRGTCFRQFWDVRGVLPDPAMTPDQLREKLRDIPPIHQWPGPTTLGQHDHRDVPGAAEEEIVLVIRGELLKKYPTAVIYAHAAKWQAKKDGSIDPSQERQLVELSDAEEAAPPPEKLLLPLYEAKIEPDIYFFGFDLTSEEAKGGTGENPNDAPGWFFVIRERPGEPRFGFDLAREGPIQTVDDLAWEDAVPGGGAGSFVSAASLGSLNLQPLGPGEQEKKDQRDDDLKANAAPVTSARWAYLLYQAPMMVAVHAAEMLPK